MTERVATPDELARQAYAAAVRLLGSRDHSIAELRRKLGKRDYDTAAIDAAIEDLVAANYVNDSRYAELYAEQKINHGHGPLAVRAKLKERGIDDHLIRQALSNLSISWSEHAESVIRKRFTATDICDTEQRMTARIARFLSARGFSSGDALRALQQLRRELGD
ncbi:MAG: regulatory protein RecX [Granulosicoccus sp.]